MLSSSVLLSTVVASHSSSFCSLLTKPHPLILLPRRRTVLYCKSLYDRVIRAGKLYNYHFIFISLLNTFEDVNYLLNLRKARAVLRWPSPQEKAGMRPHYFTHPKYILIGIIANSNETIIENVQPVPFNITKYLLFDTPNVLKEL